jgi:CheY-like chemotaxis protein
MKLLLAEDDADDRHLFHYFIKEFPQLELLPPSTNGAEVLDYLSAAEADIPDLILLDQNMPKMNGKETLIQLKAHPRWAGIPVVLYSTNADPRLVSECMALGAAAVKRKPDSEEEYNILMKSCLDLVRQD